MSVFEVLATTDAEEQERREGARAIIAAQTRAKARFEKFVSRAGSQDDLDARIGLIEGNLRDLVADAVGEYGGDSDRVYLATTAVLGGGHASDCGCGFCANKGSFGQEEEDEGDEKEASVKTACGCAACAAGDHDNCEEKKEAKLARYHVAEVETGDHYQSETLDLGSTTGDEPWSDKGSPEIDKGKSGDHTGWDLEPIDVGSVRNKLEKQDITDGADYSDPDFLRDTSSPIHDDADVTKATEPQNSDSQSGTWTGTEGQADPVTSENPVTSKLRNWTVVED